MTSYHFAIFYLLKASHQVQPNFKSTNARRQGPLRAMPEAVYCTHPTSSFLVFLHEYSVQPWELLTGTQHNLSLCQPAVLPKGLFIVSS